jgi:hypothetical protein
VPDLRALVRLRREWPGSVCGGPQAEQHRVRCPAGAADRPRAPRLPLRCASRRQAASFAGPLGVILDGLHVGNGGWSWWTPDWWPSAQWAHACRDRQHRAVLAPLNRPAWDEFQRGPPPCPVSCSFRQLATHVPNGMSTMRRNDCRPQDQVRVPALSICADPRRSARRPARESQRETNSPGGPSRGRAPPRRVVAADGFLVRPIQQAIHRAVAVVVELDLANPELVGPCVAGIIRRSARWPPRASFRCLVKVHELWHRCAPVCPLVSMGSGWPACLVQAVAVIVLRPGSPCPVRDHTHVAASRPHRAAIHAICQPACRPLLRCRIPARCDGSGGCLFPASERGGNGRASRDGATGGRMPAGHQASRSRPSQTADVADGVHDDLLRLMARSNQVRVWAGPRRSSAIDVSTEALRVQPGVT